MSALLDELRATANKNRGKVLSDEELTELFFKAAFEALRNSHNTQSACDLSCSLFISEMRFYISEQLFKEWQQENLLDEKLTLSDLEDRNFNALYMKEKK